MSYKSEISGLLSGDNALGALYLGLSAAVIVDALPTPMDALFFKSQMKIKEQYEKGEITPKQYWVKDAAQYFGYDTIWWLFVLGITVSVKTTTRNKFLLAAGLIGTGAVIGVIHKNIIKDEESKKLKNGL